MNASGDAVMEPVFEDALPFHEGLASVKVDGKWGAIDPRGNMVIRPCSSLPLRFSEGRAEFGNSKGLRGVMKPDGAVVVGPRYDAISSFQESLAYVRDRSQSYGFINLMGQEVIPPFFEEARAFCGGLAPARMGGKWGFIDRSARFVIGAQFS
jgi:hypothetical protein